MCMIHAYKGKVLDMKSLWDEERLFWEHWRWDLGWIEGYSQCPAGHSLKRLDQGDSEPGFAATQPAGAPPAGVLPAYQPGAARVHLFIWCLLSRSPTWLPWILGRYKHSIYNSYLFETPSNLYKKEILDLTWFNFPFGEQSS